MVQRYRASGSGVYAEDAGAYVKYVAYEKLQAELNELAEIARFECQLQVKLDAAVKEIEELKEARLIKIIHYPGCVGDTPAWDEYIYG